MTNVHSRGSALIRSRAGSCSPTVSVSFCPHADARLIPFRKPPGSCHPPTFLAKPRGALFTWPRPGSQSGSALLPLLPRVNSCSGSIPLPRFLLPQHLCLCNVSLPGLPPSSPRGPGPACSFRSHLPVLLGDHFLPGFCNSSFWVGCLIPYLPPSPSPTLTHTTGEPPLTHA